MFKYFLPLFLAGCAVSNAPKDGAEDHQLVANLQQHVRFLADDKLEGRRTGTPGEKLAADYIAEAFRKAGLEPRGANQFFQTFEIAEGRQINPSTHLLINSNNLQLNRDFFPLVYSANFSLEAMPSVALEESGMPWFLDVKELLAENKSNPHFDLNAAVVAKARSISKKGATGLFVYNSSSAPDGLKFDSRDNTETLSIPVVYITADAAKKYLSDPSAMLDIKLKTDIGPKKRIGTNVAAYIDNGASNTVVLGAHFDHLGYGEDRNSLATGTGNQIHNGADDNASGTAALLELARLLKNSKLTGSNYLFIAFSGEELGLYGSKHFTENPTIPLSSIRYMINMDMVGRLNDSARTITVGGYGTSPSWGQIYTNTSKKLFVDRLQFRFDSSGTGPSDHTSFYKKDIPVLFYFTGLHSDYHKPGDDAEKINYRGQANIVKHIYSVIENSNGIPGKLAFTKTREVQTSTTARFSVSMGIMPDYTFSGAGVKVDGVTENRPAQKAGIKIGDIIIAIGDYNITSMESYMQTLGKLKKGDKVKVVYKRSGQTQSTLVEFL